MFIVIRLIAVLALTGATAGAQTLCRAQGLDSATYRDGVRILVGQLRTAPKASVSFYSNQFPRHTRVPQSCSHIQRL